MEKEGGFTLVEVVASLVIITLILMFFSSIFVQNNKVSIRNSDKLVVTNIADAYLERLKVDKYTVPVNHSKNSICNGTSGTTMNTTYPLNGYTYSVKIERKNIVNDQLCNTVVTVTGKDGKVTGVVEGYVKFK